VPSSLSPARFLLPVIFALGTFCFAPPGHADTPPAADNEPYHLTADRLEGSAGAGENVYTAIHPTVVHGTTTVTGDTAIIYKSRELVLFRGNVRIVDGKTHMWGREASYERKLRLATLRGDVRIEDGSAHITGQEARFYRTENRSVITGHPVLQDSTRTLLADRIEYDRGKDFVYAIGHVDAVDRAESTRVRAGRVRYDRHLDHAWAEIEPVLEREEQGGRKTIVRGDSLEFDNPTRRAYAMGNVRVERETLRATGTRAEFYRNEDRALLLGNPRAWDREGVARGDTIEIRFAQNRVRNLRMYPHAVVEYQAKADSGRGERNTATGDSITLSFDNEEAREALIMGNAESRYWPSSADSAEGGRNVSNGDTIRVAFEKGKPVRAVVRGGSRGTYYMAAEGDTARSAAREIVNYRGTEIFYDIKGGIVDIQGNADVTYREVRLTADRVTFDSNSNHMRAEGNPVLNDGKDRITGFTMTYDLNTRQGTVYGGRTTYEQGFIYGERVHRVSENVLDVANGTYSTCDLREPHYHFGSSKMKVLLQDKVVARPVVFYIKHVPVLALPFYVFPIKTGRHSGFQLPQVEFGSSTAGGKFVRNVGYYWAISDFMDATGWFDYYQQQSWIAHGQYRYHKRYGYQGQIGGSYENRYSTGQTRWDLIGTHYQTLGTNFALTAQANLTNSSQYLRDQTLGQSVLLRVQRNLRSNASLQRSWSSGAFNLGLLQTQDLDAEPGHIKNTQQLPSVTLRLNPGHTIGRPARLNERGRLPWLSTTTYSFDAVGLYERKEYEPTTMPESTVVFDTLEVAVDTLVTNVAQDSTDARGAFRSDVTLADVRTLLGFLRVSPRVSLSGVYYSRDQAGDRNQLGGVWNAAVGANTAVFGTFRSGIGPLRAIRHVITPSVSFAYQPKNTSLSYRDSTGVLRPRFEGVSGIDLSGGESKLVTFSLRNDIHIKWGSAAQPKVINNLIQLQTIGSYNVLAKRVGAKPLSDLSTSLRLKPIERSDFAFDFLHNPYDGRLLRFGAATGIFLQGQSRTGEEEETVLEEPGAAAVRDPNALTPQGLTPGGLPWMLNLSISHGGSRARKVGGGYGPWFSQTTVRGATGLNLTKSWRFDYSCQFDVKTGRMVSQAFTVKRDLHCWEMQFTRSISGDIADEYYFKINVKNLPEVYYEQGSRGLRGFGGVQNTF
jgi:lipopolysaccharide assembly outer membrane protein LptD (OstA)